MAKSWKLRGPKIVVDPPGPRSKAAMARKEKFVTDGIKVQLPAEIDVAEGPFLRDVDGNVYLDFTVGLGVLNCGHRPKEVVKAWKDQIDKFEHICFMVSTYEPYLRLAEEMAKISPGDLTKSIFVTSGSEAIENAVKIARAYTKKRWLVSYTTAFHGRTYLDISLSGEEMRYREGFGPVMPFIRQVEYAYCYRCHLGLEYPSCKLACADAIEEAVNSEPLMGDVCCLIAEPVQGSGGFINPPKGYWERVKEICEDNRILFIDDEIQAGFGRTGKFFGIENWDVEPDIMVTGKSLSMGLPIGAVTGRAEIMDAPSHGSLGGTYGGAPIACAGALEAIKLAKMAIPNVKMVHSVTKRRMDGWMKRFEAVGDVRGMGAMMAIEFVKTKKGKEPAPELARSIQMNCFRKGLYLTSGGKLGNVVRLHPPININKTLLQKGLDIIESALEEETIT